MKKIVVTSLALGLMTTAAMAIPPNGPHHPYASMHPHMVPHHMMYQQAHPGPVGKPHPAQVRHFYGHHLNFVNTFGMDKAQAEGFMTRLESYLDIEPKQQKAWAKMKTAYVDMADSFDRHLKPALAREARGPKGKVEVVPRQQRLQERAEFLTAKASKFNTFVQARGELEKVFSPEQMKDFDSATTFGHINLTPPGMEK